MKDYLEHDAWPYEAQGFARTYVLAGEDAAAPAIKGFYSISMARVQVTELPPEATSVLPQHALPVALLGRLARDDRSPPGTGEQLLLAALEKILDVAEAIGCWGVLLHAKNARLVDYYREYGFAPVKRRQDRQAMFLSLATLRASRASAD